MENLGHSGPHWRERRSWGPTKAGLRDSSERIGSRSPLPAVTQTGTESVITESPSDSQSRSGIGAPVAIKQNLGSTSTHALLNMSEQSDADTLIHSKNKSIAFDDAPDNPALSDVVERNIRTILRLRAKYAQSRNLQDRLADAITALSGRLSFVYLHIIWFGVWIVLNAGWFGIKPFDPYPYGLLTTVVSLEAIFLSTFVLISQNRLSEEADRRAELDLHIGLLTEAELTRTIKMLHAIQNKLGIECDDQTELADLEMPTSPEDVLREIERLKRRSIR